MSELKFPTLIVNTYPIKPEKKNHSTEPAITQNDGQPPDNKSRLIGKASVNIGDAFCIREVTIRERDGKLTVFMPSIPSKKSPQGFKNICHPITSEFYDYLHNAIITTFDPNNAAGKKFPGNDQPYLDVTVHPYHAGKTVALASVVVGKHFVVDNMKLIQKDNQSIFITTPTQQYAATNRETGETETKWKKLVEFLTPQKANLVQNIAVSQLKALEFEKVKEQSMRGNNNPQQTSSEAVMEAIRQEFAQAQSPPLQYVDNRELDNRYPNFSEPDLKEEWINNMPEQLWSQDQHPELNQEKTQGIEQIDPIER